MDESKSRLEVLLDVLTDRSIDLRKDDVAWAFQSAQTKESINRYVDEYLTPNTLLTFEELHIFESISDRSKGKASRSQDENSTALRDLDFDTALQSLEQSTLAIEKQCTALEAQKAALSSLISITGPPPEKAMSRPVVPRSGSQYRSRALAEVEGRVADVSLLLDQEWRRSKEANRLASNTANYQLDLDDQILERLQSSIENAKPADHGIPTITGVDKLCSRLSTFRSKALRKEVDDVYRQALTEATAAQEEAMGSEQVNAAVLSSLSMGLDTLMGELDSVLQMVVEHEHRRSIMSELRLAKQQADAARTQQDDYTLDLLAHMAQRLSLLAEFVRESHAQSTAYHAIDQVTQQIRASTINNTVGSSRSVDLARRQGSPTRDQCSKDLLRQLDVRLPERVDKMEIDRALGAALSASALSNERLSRSTEDGLFEQLEKSLSTAEHDLRHLTEALFAHTSFNTPRLAAPIVEEQMQDLDRRATAAGKEMAEMDSTVLARQVKAHLAELTES
ncbi:hypothetical protein MBLNU457_3505t1 [Dothideomycetes sp. NU457]